MKEPIGAGVVAGAIAVTAGGGANIVAEGWPQAALVALAVGSAFGLGGWFPTGGSRRSSRSSGRSARRPRSTTAPARTAGFQDAEARKIAERLLAGSSRTSRRPARKPAEGGPMPGLCDRGPGRAGGRALPTSSATGGPTWPCSRRRWPAVSTRSRSRPARSTRRPCSRRLALPARRRGRDRAGAGPGLTGRSPGRALPAVADAPGATVANLGGYGYVGLEVHADGFTAEDVYDTHSLDGSSTSISGGGRVHGCVHGWGRRGRRCETRRFRRCSAERSDDHGSPSTSPARARAAASRTSSTTSATPSRRARVSRAAGSATGPAASRSPTLVMSRRTVRDCWSVDRWQDGFHLDGSGTATAARQGRPLRATPRP